MRRLHRLVLVGAPALVLCLAGPAAAGSISISILPVVELREGALSAQVKVSNVGMFRDPGRDGLVLVTFDQEYRSNNLSNTVKKRQYWLQEGGRWRIVYEGTV